MNWLVCLLCFVTVFLIYKYLFCYFFFFFWTVDCSETSSSTSGIPELKDLHASRIPIPKISPSSSKFKDAAPGVVLIFSWVTHFITTPHTGCKCHSFHIQISHQLSRPKHFTHSYMTYRRSFLNWNSATQVFLTENKAENQAACQTWCSLLRTQKKPPGFHTWQQFFLCMKTTFSLNYQSTNSLSKERNMQK